MTLVIVAVSCDEGTNAGVPDEAARAPIAVEAAEVVERPITRFVRVTGTLTAQEQAEVAAETTGRIVATPVERGTGVSRGSTLVRIATAEVEAQLKEAQANVAQIQARLGQSGEDFDLERVPEVAVAKASRQLAEADFDRIRMLFERKLVSQAEFDLRRAQAENAERQYESARNSAEQQRQTLAAAQARLALAQKAVADATVRAPFDGVVAERLVSVGDYVTRGTRVATVMRVKPLRVELTVPAQYIADVVEGRPVSLEVDGFPGRTFTGEVRYVSPGLRADSRALVVEAVVPNEGGTLKPGLFVAARIEDATPTPGLLVPAAAVRTVAGTSRVFVVNNGRVEERIVTIGQAVGDLIEVSGGLDRGAVVATTNAAQLGDGARVTVER
jgi:multidrug efflux pump subunit AcrA (membrane-fusion protein)